MTDPIILEGHPMKSSKCAMTTKGNKS